MSTPLFVVSLVIAGIALWVHGYRVARRSPPRIRRSRGDFTDPDSRGRIAAGPPCILHSRRPLSAATRRAVYEAWLARYTHPSGRRAS